MNQFSTEDQSAARVRHHSPWRRAWLSLSGLMIVATMAAACGSSPSTPVVSGGAPAAALVSTTNNAQLGTILVNNKGFTLYTLRGNAPCDAACTAVWPPLLVTGSAKPNLGSSVTGLGTVKVSGGEQVVYNGMALYTFTGDSSAGQVSGQDVTDTWGTWFAAVTKASTAPTTTPPAGGTSSTTVSTTVPTGGTSSTTGGGGGGIGF
jgi:predicted lipoprotein with Yx(FWY)xxD motif